jgi:squalene-hopene/tetraprenyl-beta-curcumene cyclase
VIHAAVRWLLGLQNRDGGFPTFCRGWGALPFDRSSPDITAHAVRALIRTFRGFLRTEPTVSVLTGESGAWGGNWITPAAMPLGFGFSIPKSVGRGFRFLRRSQRPDGSWLPLWFGNQDAPDDINPTYGTARVLAAFRDAGLADDPAAKRGIAWLLENQNDDGGWGGVKGVASSVEETALAVEILCDLAPGDERTGRGVGWLIRAVEDGSFREPSPIGFYFAKLWYFERLYPVIFTVAALRAARRGLKPDAVAGHDGAASTAP